MPNCSVVTCKNRSVTKNYKNNGVTYHVNDDNQKVDSPEDVQPKKEESHVNMGFEMYWPGGEWVARQAAADYCNTSDAECSAVFKDYGRVCAGSSDLQAHHTFETICELHDTNCRDGTASFFTTSNNPKDIRWFPVKRNSFFTIKFSVPGVMMLILARGKDINMEPQFTFEYGTGKSTWDVDLMEKYNAGTYLTNQWFTFWPVGDTTFSRNGVRTFRISWDETAGQVTWTLLDENWWHYRDQAVTLPNKPWLMNPRKFPVRYVGIYGGNKTHPHWHELTGLPRGYLMTYRGRCREDLPTLPTDAPRQISERHKIQLFNFAERMDEFGFNFSRVPSSTIKNFGGDYFSDYHMFP